MTKKRKDHTRENLGIILLIIILVPTLIIVSFGGQGTLKIYMNILGRMPWGYLFICSVIFTLLAFIMLILESDTKIRVTAT